MDNKEALQKQTRTHASLAHSQLKGKQKLELGSRPTGEQGRNSLQVKNGIHNLPALNKLISSASVQLRNSRQYRQGMMT